MAGLRLHHGPTGLQLQLPVVLLRAELGRTLPPWGLPGSDRCLARMAVAKSVGLTGPLHGSPLLGDARDPEGDTGALTPRSSIMADGAPSGGARKDAARIV